MIFSVAFKDGKAFFRNKFVKTKGFLEEQVRRQAPVSFRCSPPILHLAELPHFDHC